MKHTNLLSEYRSKRRVHLEKLIGLYSFLSMQHYHVFHYMGDLENVLATQRFWKFLERNFNFFLCSFEKLELPYMKKLAEDAIVQVNSVQLHCRSVFHKRCTYEFNSNIYLLKKPSLCGLRQQMPYRPVSRILPSRATKRLGKFSSILYKSPVALAL